MHCMKPNTKYKIVMVGLVCSNESEAALADGINEMLRESMCMDNPMVVDYSVDFGGPVLTSDDAPEEGDLVPPIVRCAE